MRGMASQAGYSGTPLPRKPASRTTTSSSSTGVPAGLALGELGIGGAHVVRRLRAGLDVTLTFHTTYATLAARLPVLFDRT